MSILQQKQLEQGAAHILKYIESQQEYMDLTLVGISWDVGRFNMEQATHTLTVLDSSGALVKEEFENREVEECYSMIKPSVEQKIKKLLTRLKEAT